MKLQEKPVRTPLMILLMLSSFRDIPAFEDAGKMAPKMVHLSFNLWQKGGKIFYICRFLFQKVNYEVSYDIY